VILTLGDALVASQSTDWVERVDAARALVGWAGNDQADAALLRLLDDGDDAAPVFAAAEALLASATTAALRLFAVGWATCDVSSADWMADALRTSLGSGSLGLDTLEALAQDDDARVRTGVQAILHWARQ
jgi:hypothetical protein